MINLLIIIGLVVLIYLAIKIEGVHHKILFIVAIFLILFVYITFTIVDNRYGLRFDDFSSSTRSIMVYLEWLVNGFEDITGNAVALNQTNVSS